MGSIWGRLMDALKLIPNADEFLLEIAKLGMRRRESGAGYRILFGKGRV